MHTLVRDDKAKANKNEWMNKMRLDVSTVLIGGLMCNKSSQTAWCQDAVNETALQ